MTVTNIGSKHLSVVGALLLCALTSGCVTHEFISLDAIKVIHATDPAAEDQLLDIGVVVFDPNIPEDEEQRDKTLVFTAVRKAESRYFPYNLRTTLASTGNWGTVRVLPDKSTAVDLLVLGRILSSDGETLEVKIVAEDNTGRVWLDKEYSQRASHFAYSDINVAEIEPFQDLYDTISNDLLIAREGFTDTEIINIRQIAELRYAADLAPPAFETYLNTDPEGKYQITRLPAQNDPMMNRIYRIRSSEHMFIDTLDEHYAVYCDTIEDDYQNWRRYSYEEASALRELRSESRTRTILGAATALLGGTDMLKSGMDMRDQSRIHADALRELSESLEVEIDPHTVELEGTTVTLVGSIEDQYAQWRSLLGDIHDLETGFGSGSAFQPGVLAN